MNCQGPNVFTLLVGTKKVSHSIRPNPQTAWKYTRIKHELRQTALTAMCASLSCKVSRLQPSFTSVHQPNLKSFRSSLACKIKKTVVAI